MKKFFSCALFAVVAIATHAQPCTDLFISEYMEGSAFNKAIEIYNPTAGTVALTGYKLQLFINGSDTVNVTYLLTDSIAAGDVYILANSQADSAVKATADTVLSSITNFNGDDAIALLHDTIIIDQIGEVGVDPGTNWPVGTGATSEFTLVRKPSIQAGSTNWATGATEWNVLPRDSFQLGAHNMTACGVITVRFASIAATVNEADSTYNVNLILNQAPTTDKSVDLVLRSGNATDFANFLPVTVVLPADSISTLFTLLITNDALPEATELFEFALTNPASGITVDADSIFTLTIIDDDSIVPPPPFRTIGEVTTVDADGVPDSAGLECRLRGVVYGINLRNTGLQFTIHDGTGGIGTFSSANDFGYTVNEGDSVVVQGEIGHFLGLAQIVLDSMYEVGTGTLRQPTNTTVLDESTESELVRINDVWLVDPSQWDDSIANGFAVDITNGTETFEMRIEEQVDLFHDNPPTVHFDVIGLGGQFNSSSNPPFDNGYQILPRYSDDLILHVGIDSKFANNFVIYPNPNQGIFSVRLAKPAAREITVRISDLAGHIVLSERKNTAESALTVNASLLASGLYILEISSGNSVQRQKISIQ